MVVFVWKWGDFERLTGILDRRGICSDGKKFTRRFLFYFGYFSPISLNDRESLSFRRRLL